MKNKFDYAQMQKTQYECDASVWSLENLDAVVGSFKNHNEHKDYDLLFAGFDCKEMVALDFGCGPGRNLVRHGPKFKRMDGVDISPNNLKNAKLWLEYNGRWRDKIKLYECNGLDLASIESNSYDFLMSTITLQHICVHEIRFGLFEEFLRVLKPEGWISLQMAYGSRVDARQKAAYHDNLYEAEGTNGWSDTMVDDPNYLKNDLEKIGFSNFSYEIRPVGPGDKHPNWIFFRAQK